MFAFVTIGENGTHACVHVVSNLKTMQVRFSVPFLPESRDTRGRRALSGWGDQ